MATFQEIQTRVGTIIIDLPTSVTSQLPKFVNEACRKLQSDHNFRIMEATTAVATTSYGVATLAAVPSNWKEPRGVPIMIGATGTTWPLRYCLDRAEAYRYFGTTDGGEADIDFVTGTPRVIYQSEPTDETLGTRNFLMAPLPNQNSLYTDGNYRIFIPYWKYLALLSASGDQNWFTVNAEEWLTYQAASLAFLANEDEQAAAAWAQVAASKYQDVLSTDKDSRVADAGEVLIPRRDADRPKYAQGLNHRWPWGWGRRF